MRLQGMLVVMVAGVVAGPAGVSAVGNYPLKPIRIIVPFTPGGSNDLVARVLSQEFHEAWGQPVIIDNRPGGGSTIGIEMAVRAAPDGYTPPYIHSAEGGRGGLASRKNSEPNPASTASTVKPAR